VEEEEEEVVVVVVRSIDYSGTGFVGHTKRENTLLELSIAVVWDTQKERTHY